MEAIQDAVAWGGHALLRKACPPAQTSFPEIAPERYAASALGVSVPQLRFALALCAAVPLGAGLRAFTSPTARHLYALLSGLLLVYFPFGMGITQVALPLVVTYAAMALAPRHCGAIAWLNMAFLIYLHVVNASGEAWNQGQMDFTGGCMVTVLKLIALARCRQDAYTQKAPGRKGALNDYQAEHKVDRLPGLLEYLGYAFCCGNLLSGPFLEYADYKDCIEEKRHWALCRTRDSKYVQYGLRRVAESVVSMVAMLYMEPRFGPPMLFKPWFMSQPIYKKLLLHWLCGAVCQLRYSFVWLMSEASLTLAGFNLKGWVEEEKNEDGTTKKKGGPIWGLYSNCNWIGVQLSESARALPQSWNTCTGVFLRRYVYERLTPAGKRPGFPQLMGNQLVAGVWHGLYPGYLLFFASSALMFQASSGIAQLEELVRPDWAKKDEKTGKRGRPLPIRVLHMAITGIMLDHLAMAFVLLDFKRSMAVFKDVLFIPHIFMLVCTITSLLLPRPKRTGPGGESKINDGTPRGAVEDKKKE